MHLPDAYNTKDRKKIIQFIEENSFGDLVTSHNHVLCSNKVPFFFDGESNTLYGHLGKANAQLKDLEQSEDVLVIFSGAHSYISPKWYLSENAVPTWNYQTLQCKGKASLVDKQGLLAILANLTRFHEATFPEPWTMAALDPEKQDKMVNLLTGFKITITDIQFKEKMSQTRDTDDRKNIIKALDNKSAWMSKKVAQIMRGFIDV